MKSNYRGRKAKTQPQAGGIGAPSRGVFKVRVSAMDLGLGEATISAFEVLEDGSIDDVAMWTPNRVMDIAAIRVYLDGVETPIFGVNANANGKRLMIGFPNTATMGALEVIAAHPSLVAANGMQCGGCYGTP
jgi:hypothetical protein